MELWGVLSAEIRSVILEIVAEDYRFKSEPYARAGYASVCREWQQVFEPRNFERLIIDQDRISGLERFMGKEATKHRRDYLNHLCLRVRLDEYDCTVCQSKEDRETIKKNDDVFSRAVWRLLIILSKWTEFPRNRGCSRFYQGLRLELSAYSPSDSKHTFKNFHLEPNYPYQELKDLERNFDGYKLRAGRLGLDSLNDPHHGWIDGHRDREGVSLESKQRIMGTLTIKLNLREFSTFSKKFPKVEIVTSLLIRRQFYRKIAVRSLGKLVRETFTGLRIFRHEGWHDVNPQQQLSFEKDYKNLISRALPSSLQNLFIFEDFNKVLHPDRSSKRADPYLGIALSKSSRFLQHLSAAFLVDAEHFFANFWLTKAQTLDVIPWENLQTLALTSRLLHPKIRRWKIERLLIAAGRAAAFMPKLETMEIWNGGEEHACIFRYNNNSGEPQITLASNWFIFDQLRYNVVHCWANLPQHRQHPHVNLAAKIKRIRKAPKNVKTYVATLYRSKLRGMILDVISDYQLCWEDSNGPG